MAKPIYAGSYNNRRGGGWKRVFIIIILIQIIAVGVYLYVSKNKKNDDEGTPVNTELNLSGSSLPELAAPIAPPLAAVSTPQSQAVVSDARAFIEGGQLLEAKTALDNLVAETPDPDAVKLLGEVNMKLLNSSLPMPGKEYYQIQGGDSLSKIAGKYGTTVALLKKMNGMETDMIRRGASLLAFRGDFTVRVSKSRNELDLLLNGKLFKRYSVGTGKFGKTPVAEFKIVDKIEEPPWTRPTDGKQIEYGDEENVLGTRWMKITAEDHPEITGYGIHGTWERNSIGKQSSAGCVRMLNEDVEELFDLVPRKTTVIITE